MILIYLKKHTARSEYVFGFIFKEQFGIAYKVTEDLNEFENFTGSKINYSTQRLLSGFYIHNNGLLQDDSLKRVEIIIGETENIKVLFPSTDCDLGFDLFAGTFYMLSRYEEYLPFTEDRFGRFKAEDSLAFKNGFLEMPIIDAGIHLLAEKMDLGPSTSTFNAVMTYDIDVAFKFKGRNFERNLGSMVKDLLKMDFRNLHQRTCTFLNLKKDPWDIYDDLKESLSNHQLNSVFFFLVGNNSEYDRNLDYNTPVMENLIRDISQFTEVGIHPSFSSNRSLKKMMAEKERLEFILGKKVRKSRQHYLKMHFPTTYLNLVEAGIKEDYSMGFPEHPGFRAGTCKPFYFYDLKNEVITELKIFPVSCMEATFIYYDKITPEKALIKILQLMKTVHQYGGTFVPIWHNENLSSTGTKKSWKKVHDQMLRQVQTYLNK